MKKYIPQLEMSVAEYKEYVGEPKKPKHPESALQTKICKWLRKEFPGLLFFTDFAAGFYFKEDWIKSLRSAQSCDGKYLDVTIMRPNETYHALIIEIKCTYDDLFLKDCQTLKSSHVQEQYNSILELRKYGYYADFGVGEDNIKYIVRDYFANCVEPKVIKPFRGTMPGVKEDILANNFFSQHNL